MRMTIGRGAVVLRAAFLTACVAMGLATSAEAQIPSNLDPAKNVISINMYQDSDLNKPVSGNVTAECGAPVEVLAQWVDPTNPGDFDYWYEWRDAATDEPVAVLDGRLVVPAQEGAAYRFVVYHNTTGSWGEAYITVHSGDQTAPMIWLNWASTITLNCGDNYFESGWGVFDNCDTNVSVTVTGQVNAHEVGTYVLTYTATDDQGNTASVQRTVHVVYSFSGFLAPVDSDGKSVFKLGSTIPLRFQLTGACSCKTDLVAKLYLAKISNGVVGTEVAAETNVAADSGNVFRYQNGTYMFNLSTKGLSEGSWLLRVDLGDGAVHGVIVSLKK